MRCLSFLLVLFTASLLLAWQSPPPGNGVLSLLGVTPGSTTEQQLLDNAKWGKPALKTEAGGLVLWEYRQRGYRKVVMALHQGTVRSIDCYLAEGTTMAKAAELMKLGQVVADADHGPEVGLGSEVPKGARAVRYSAGRVVVFGDKDEEPAYLVRLYAATDIQRDVKGLPERPAVPGTREASCIMARNIAQMLTDKHLTRHPLDAEISQRWLTIFLADLDATKIIFRQSDIDLFKKHESDYADRLRQGDVDFIFDMFKTYLQRRAQYLKLAEEWLAKEHDFSANEELVVKFQQAEFPQNDDQAREISRKRVKYDLLVLRADGIKDEDARERLSRRYQKQYQVMKNFTEEALMAVALNALANAFDVRSIFISARDWQKSQAAFVAQLEGIGVQISTQDDAFVVKRLIPGGPALKDGRLQVGDRIAGVFLEDGKLLSAEGLSLDDFIVHIRGKAGTKVRLEVIPKGQAERIIFSLTRDKIVTDHVRSQILSLGKKDDDQQLKCGYLFLPSFYGPVFGQKASSSTEEVRAILKGFEEQEVDFVLLDLRTNSGGVLREALAVTDHFIDQGPLLQQKNSKGDISQENAKEAGMVCSKPLVVLTSRRTASGAELFVGALQSHGRALVIGEPTFGVGSVQKIFNVETMKDVTTAPPRLGVARITMSQFYRPNGESTQKRGILPDVELPWFPNPEAGETDQVRPTLEFDRIDALRFERAPFGIDEVLRKQLRTRSMARLKASPDFQDLAKNIDLSKARQNRGTISLNLKKFVEERANLSANDQLVRKLEEAPRVVDIDYYLQEVLTIGEDYVKHYQESKAR